MKKFVLKSLGFLINITAPVFPKWNRNYSFKLLCKVKRIGLTTNGRQFFTEGTTTYLNIENQKIALHKWGNGPKNLFFVHGWMSNSQRWQPYVAGLDPNDYTCYALDAQGHGLSDGDALNIEAYRKAVVEAIEKIGQVEVLVGHSLGSLVVGYTFLVNPKLPAKSYVIMGAPSGMDAIFTYFKNMLSLSRASVQNLLEKVNSELKIPADQLTIANFFAEIQKPTLVIHDENDNVCPFVSIEAGLKANPDIKTFFTKDLGHNLENDRVVKKVLNYVKQTQSKPQLQD